MLEPPYRDDQPRRSVHASGVALCVFILAALIVIRSVARERAPLWGDGVEYAATLLAWINHASPDIRSEDLGSIQSPFLGLGYEAIHPNMVATAASGARYGIHFWFYPLVCAPAALLLRSFGSDPLAAFPVTNAMLFVSLIGVACFARRISVRDRVMVALAAVGPVIFYLPFAHPEAFTWAGVLASLLAINQHRYALGAVCAASGAMQYAPVASLAVWCVVLAAYERKWRSACLAAAAVPLCAVPSLFYLLAIDQPAPLFRPGFVDWRLATPARVWSMLTDLNQGLLPYVPGLLLLATIRLRYARNLRHVGMLGVLLLFIGGAAVSENWNSALNGLMRYAIWVLPLVAWLATEPPAVVRLGIVAVAIAVHGALLLVDVPLFGHTRLAAYALAHWPSWYQPDHEIFGERTLGMDWRWRSTLPLGFTRVDRTVSLVLTDARSLPDLERLFTVESGYMARVTAAYGKRTGLFYLVPPNGSVRSRCQRDLAAQRALLRGIRIHARWPDDITARRTSVMVDLINETEAPLCNLGAGGSAAFNLGFRIGDQRATTHGSERTRAPQLLLPGESRQQEVTVVLPERTGRYIVEILLVAEDYEWATQGSSFAVEVRNEGGRYRATTAPEAASGDA